ncbi:MAG: inner rane protein [Mucilaginibacter sp.]|nr:inner rane protein [Mucilaginibacter sp.]
MDSVTHLALGACTGEILLGKKLGKKALLWGALAQNLPDADTFVSEFFSADKGYLIHRGITHSLSFAIVIGLGLALAAKSIHRKQNLSFALLAFFFCFQLMIHDLLDTCNSYGTGLLEPFSHQRFSINLLFVADPLFTISLVVAFLFLIFKDTSNKQRLKWAWAGIIVSAFYLCFAGFNKLYIDHQAEASFNNQKLHPESYFSTPAPFNCMLWYIVAAADSGYNTGYVSIWDNFNQPVDYGYHPKNYALINNNVNNSVLHNLKEFAGDYFTISQSGNDLYFNILRFQQRHGWLDSNAPFAFSYPLTSGNADGLLLQRGRLAGWNKNTLKAYLMRIAGKKYTLSPLKK